MTRRPVILVVAATVLILLVALPVLAVPPSSPPGLDKAKVEKTPITITGTVEVSSDADGKPVYTLTDAGRTYRLHAGPQWFFGDSYPLAKYVGQVVTIDGELAEGSDDVDVLAVDDQALREPGRPPWAGGWKRVGELHPGWSQAKADRFAAKAERFGGCFPPGQCKDTSTADEASE